MEAEVDMHDSMMDTGDGGDDYGLSQSAPGAGDGSSRSSRWPPATTLSPMNDCRQVLGCLYKEDMALYARACAQPRLRSCEPVRRACETELARMPRMCGVTRTRGLVSSLVHGLLG